MGLWTGDDVQVYSAVPSDVWVDLDLSAIVGANVALVLLGMNQTATMRTAVRPKDSTLTPLHMDSSTHGSSFTIAYANKWNLLLCTTNADGVLQHKTNFAVGTLTIRVLGHNKMSHPGPTLLDIGHTFPVAGWEDYDISGEIGQNKSFSLLGYVWIGGIPPVLALRSVGDIRDAEYTGDGDTGGVNRGITAAAGHNGMFAGVITDALGVYQHKQASNPASVSAILHEGSEVTDYVDVNTVIQDSILTDDTWYNLNLSAHVKARALCFILVERGAIGAQSPVVTCRREGEVLDFSYGGPFIFGPGAHNCGTVIDRAGVLTVECNDDGIVDIYPHYGILANTSIKFTLLGYIRSRVEPPHGHDISPENSLIALPCVQHFARAADGKVVTPVIGKTDITEALMGSDGVTAVEFPSLILPRGFSFDGGDQINVGDVGSFAGVGGDEPFTCAVWVRHTSDQTRTILQRGLAAGVDLEWALSHEGAAGIMHLTLYDPSGADYIGRTAPFHTNIGAALVATYDGSETSAGVKIYSGVSQVDNADDEGGAYGGMTDNGGDLLVGSSVVGDVGVPMVYDFGLTEAQALVLCWRLNYLYMVTP